MRSRHGVRLFPGRAAGLTPDALQRRTEAARVSLKKQKPRPSVDAKAAAKIPRITRFPPSVLSESGGQGSRIESESQPVSQHP